jgi:hypothetical protein
MCSGGRRRSVQIEEKASRSTLHLLALALFGDFARLLAVLATHGERQRPETPLRDFIAAFETVAVGALGVASQGFFDLV